jgi:hypothetical protein
MSRFRVVDICHLLLGIRLQGIRLQGIRLQGIQPRRVMDITTNMVSRPTVQARPLWELVLKIAGYFPCTASTDTLDTSRTLNALVACRIYAEYVYRYNDNGVNVSYTVCQRSSSRNVSQGNLIYHIGKPMCEISRSRWRHWSTRKSVLG